MVIIIDVDSIPISKKANEIIKVPAIPENKKREIQKVRVDSAIPTSGGTNRLGSTNKE